ncbi:probable galacturonosyltransferase 6 isoform X1 [Vigna unguiculata]|uniref:probable galacturonosyltransferase 6 isoform X1 n=1 Tax=Vigna unguiculata TaxID=3917 RepID=UPI001016955B|nr:probable galacturonosyltransferase 6 isoform X1 [Vigna unguiculata]
MKSSRWWQRTLILALLSVSVVAPVFLVYHRLNLTPYARREFQEDISSVTFRTDPLPLNAIEQEGAEELEEPKEVVYKEKDFGSRNSSIQQKINDCEKSKIHGCRNSILERNVSEFNQDTRQDQKAQQKELFSIIGDENILNTTVTHNQSMHAHSQKTTDDNVEVTDKKSMPRATQNHNHQSSRPQPRRVLNHKVLEIKDQIIRARAYLGFASPGSTSRLMKELKLRIKEMERALGTATKDSDLSRSALQKMRHMEASLSKADRAFPDCAAMATKLRAMNLNAEGEIRHQKRETTYLVHLAARTTPRGLHCLSMQLTADYFALRPEDRKLPNENKINDPKLHHYVVFSDNVLACAVVVNSTISNAKKQGKLVFHVVTNSLNFPAIWMWFLLNPPGKATVHIQSIENFEWLLKYNALKEQSSSDPRFTSELNYLRFYLPDIFPTLNKVVLFDHDVVVQQDLSRLWNVITKGKVNAAVGTCQEGETSFHRMDMFINFSDPFIANRFDVNACTWAFGMNLFDLQQWRRQNLTALYHSYLQMGFKRPLLKTGSLPLGWLTFYNKTMILDRRWQVLGLGYDSDVDKNQIERAAVIHFDGIRKPWLDIAVGRYKSYWTKFVEFGHPILQRCNLQA